MKADSSQIAKRAAGEEAVKFVQPGMLVGLGTGSTAYYFIEKLILRCRQGLKIHAIATSKRSHEQALKGGIPLLHVEDVTSLDLTVDGADEIDPQKRMIKGGGGALLQEKIIASSSREMIVIIDESKLVPYLGGCPLPIEIVPFAFHAIIKKINEIGFTGHLRQTDDQKNYITDNGNYIYDVRLEAPCLHPESIHKSIRAIPGVVETGFFFNLAGRVLIGRDDGTVDQIN